MHSLVKSDEIIFLPSHTPALDAGEYTIEITQNISNTIGPPFSDQFQIKRKFVVHAVNRRLSPADIHAVFPYEHSTGDHENVLPHILLNRSTLPWEAQAIPGEKLVPWLALLVLHEGENFDETIDLERTPMQVTLGSLLKSANNNIVLPHITLQEGEDENDQVSIIDVDIALFKKIVPEKDALAYLCHVRKTPRFKVTSWFIESMRSLSSSSSLLKQLEIVIGFESGNAEKFLEKLLNVLISAAIEEPSKFIAVHKAHILEHASSPQEMSVVIGNRLPKANGTTTVYLVSVQNVYNAEIFEANATLVRLLCLKSWKFSCITHQKNFTTLATNLNSEFIEHLPISIKAALETNTIPIAVKKQLAEQNPPHFLSNSAILQKTKDTVGVIKNTKWKITDKDREWLITQSGNGFDLHRKKHCFLRLPTSNDSEAEKYFAAGYVLLPHYCREGSKTLSWYRGPLSPTICRQSEVEKKLKNATDKSIITPEQLLLYNSTLGMLDTSYAAAWQLGRLLALQNKHFLVNLNSWKHTYRQYCKIKDNSETHCSPHDISSSKDCCPQFPIALETWLKNLSLLDDVPFNYLVPDISMLPSESIRFFQLDNYWIYSLLWGAFSIGSAGKSGKTNTALPASLSYSSISGFLLRTEMVSGWPGLTADGFSDTDDKLDLLRWEKLSPQLVLCLFNGIIKKVSLHQQPETLHFGLHWENEVWNIKLKKSSRPLLPFTKSLWNDFSKKVINIPRLITEMRKRTHHKLNSAEFAFQMIEGTREVSLLAD